MSSIIERMKKQVERTGSSRSKIFYIKSEEKKRVRFLAEMDEAYEVNWHNEPWKNDGSRAVDSPCRKHFGEDCPYCDREDFTHSVKYVLPVYNYESNALQLMAYKYTNQYSPYPQLLDSYDTFNTITDKDFVIKKTGKALDTNYSAIGMEKNPFQQEAKLKKEIAKIRDVDNMLKILKEAHPLESETGEMVSAEVEVKVSIDDVNITFAESEETKSKSDKELYQLCKAKGIDIKPRQEREKYIEALKQAEKKVEETEDDDWDDIWNDEELDF